MLEMDGIDRSKIKIHGLMEGWKIRSNVIKAGRPEDDFLEFNSP